MATSRRCRRWQRSRERIDAWLHGRRCAWARRARRRARLGFADGGAAVPLQMGTLSRRSGSYGGYLCASRAVIELMASRARTLIYSTGLPPASVAAAIAALDIIAREPGADRAAAGEGARASPTLAGLPEAQSAIVPVRARRRERRARRLALARRAKASSSPRSARRPCPPAPRGCASPSPPRIPDEAIERLAAPDPRRISLR